MGLLDVDKLRYPYDEKKEHQKMNNEHSKAGNEYPTSPQSAPNEHPMSLPEIRLIHSYPNGNGLKKHIGVKDYWPSYQQKDHTLISLAAKGMN
ncbi:MAG: hypothetical protein GY849_16745 [Deltaproteobacteria bacterium]|nr:hypothetical protein [Deltaproteobacteria bacterium]